jgi:hypothetical protein
MKNFKNLLNHRPECNRTYFLNSMNIINLVIFFLTFIILIYLNYKLVLQGGELLKELLVEIFKHEFLPEPILCQEESLIINRTPVHFLPNELYNVKKIYCEDFFNDIVNNINPNGNLGIIKIKQSGSNFLSDSWFAYTNHNGEIV